MLSSFSKRAPNFNWVVIAVISVFLGIAASCSIELPLSLHLTVGPDLRHTIYVGKMNPGDFFIASGVEGVSQGAVQTSPECQTAKSCPSCGSNRAWTPCCAKHENSGKSYCSCKSSSSASNSCPQLLMTAAATASNGNGIVGAHGIGGSLLQAESTTITVYHPNGDFAMPKQPVTVNVKDGGLELSITAATQQGGVKYATVHNFKVQNAVLAVAQECLKNLGREEIIGLLDKEIVQQIVERHSSEILDKKVMEMD